MFYDMGLDHRNYENYTHIQHSINSLDKDFNLVLILEHFDESLIMLRRRLCWNIDDVVYFTTNALM